MTHEKYHKYGAYYGKLLEEISGTDHWHHSEQDVYNKMEQMLLGMVIIAADIDDSENGLYKLQAYIGHLISEYEKGNDELYMITRSYDCDAEEDERTCIGYTPLEMFAPYTYYMKYLYLIKASGDEWMETAKKKMHIEYLEELLEKTEKYTLKTLNEGTKDSYYEKVPEKKNHVKNIFLKMIKKA